MSDPRLEGVNNELVGFGDGVSFGITWDLRESRGLNQNLDEASLSYITGNVLGIVDSAAIGYLGAAYGAVGLRTRVAVHDAHHTFGALGRLSHIQINIWRQGIRASGRALRIPLPWR